ncbi:MAG: Crp/Fnr family transcriptional regulator [Flavobacteriales bacterium]|nr:MAG: Crp/Fnr family transcriptional regulator [Flavobacteriales bacterium]
MNFKHFFEHLQQRCEQVNEFENAIKERVKEIEVNKGQVLLYPGEVCKHVYFVLNGFLRLYHETPYQEATVDFAGPKEFTTSLPSFFNQLKSKEGIICESSGILFRISYHDWLSLEDLSPIFIFLSKVIFQEYLTIISEERNVFRTSNATQKYLHLKSRYPQISNLVSQKHIASYLGITEQSMSIIRKSLSR